MTVFPGQGYHCQLPSFITYFPSHLYFLREVICTVSGIHAYLLTMRFLIPDIPLSFLLGEKDNFVHHGNFSAYCTLSLKEKARVYNSSRQTSKFRMHRTVVLEMPFYGSMESSIKSRRKQDCFVDLNLMLHFPIYKLHGEKK